MILANNPRQYQWQDYTLIYSFKYIRALFNLPFPQVTQTRPNPSAHFPANNLSPAQKKHSAALMRINHTGEICAQALYLGQELTARSALLGDKLRTAAQEENDHLSWCAQRIAELNSHQSYLNPFWFTGSFFIGTCAGLLGDKWSLGFLAQTEQQVFAHLGKHLEKLPPEDVKSRAIVSRMQQEEAAHANMAIALGGVTLPLPVRAGMQMLAKIMTSITYFV